jgi:large subunit ribosomal protein L1
MILWGAVHEVTAARVEFEMDMTANAVVVVERRSFAADKLAENIRTAIDAIVKSKPMNISGSWMNNVTLTATMAPGLRLERGSSRVVSRRTL